jgi:hypothetical protein
VFETWLFFREELEEFLTSALRNDQFVAEIERPHVLWGLTIHAPRIAQALRGRFRSRLRPCSEKAHAQKIFSEFHVARPLKY